MDNNEGYEILEEEDPEDFSMPTSSNVALSSAASYLTSNGPTASSMTGDDDGQWSVSSLALLRSIIYIRRAKDVSSLLVEFISAFLRGRTGSSASHHF